VNKIANCPLCKSNDIAVVSGVSFAIKCQSCWHVKLQCFDSKEEAVAAWEKLFGEGGDE